MTIRKLFLKLHLYVGLLAGAVVIVIGCTGAVLVFEHEIDYALHPNLWSVTPCEHRVTLQSVVETVRAAYPDRPFVSIQMQAEAARPYVISTERDFQVFVDPYSGEILGAREYAQSFFGLMFSLHRTLLAGEIGRKVVGGTTLLVVLLLLTGLYLWWPRTAARLTASLTLKWTAGWKRLNYDLHSVLGFYASWYLLVIALTGLVWSFTLVHDAIFWLTNSPPPPWKTPPSSGATQEGPGTTLDEAMRRAEGVIPGAEATEVLLPQTAKASIGFVRRVPRVLNRNAQNFVYVDQYSGAVLRVDRYDNLSVGAKLRALVYPVHVGLIFGLPTQILALLVSLVIAASAVTGLLLWWQKRKPS